MYSSTSHGVRVTAMPEFAPDRSAPDDGAYFWIYTIEIANMGDGSVQLISRHWVITDANGKTVEVKGLGVIGEQPHLEPGESFTYTSGVPLATASGMMSGSYAMARDDGSEIMVDVPAFSLDSPFGPTTIN